MARTDTLGNFLTDVADAIRDKKGTTDTIQASNFDTEIASIESSGGDIDEYFSPTIKGSSSYTEPGWKKNLKKWRSPLTLEGTSCAYMFREFPLDETMLPKIDVSNATSFLQMFYNAKYIKEVPWLKDGKSVTLATTFSGCTALQKIESINGEYITNISGAFNDCVNLTEVAGIKNIGKAYDTLYSENYIYYRMNFAYSGKLTEQSLINILNNLYDIASKGCKTQQVILGDINLVKLTSEEGQAALASATAKGWTVS